MHAYDFRRFTPAAIGLAAVLLAPSAGAQSTRANTAKAAAVPMAGQFVTQPVLQMGSVGTDEKIILNPKVIGNPGAFRPIYQNRALSNDEYMQWKQSIANASGNLTGRPDTGTGSGGIITPFVNAGTVKYGTNGIDEIAAEGPSGYGYAWVPPDTNFAVGPNSAVQPANSGVRIFNKTATFTLSTYNTYALNTFMGEAATQNGYLTAGYDPDSYYDAAGGHFVVTCADDPWFDSGGAWHQHLNIAVSANTDIRNGWGVYQIDVGQLFKVSTPSGETFFDYPHVGFDNGNIIVTANLFDNYYGYYEGAGVLALNKAQAYALTGASGNAWGYNYSANSGYLYGTLMPPRVITEGTGGNTYLLFDYPNDNIWEYRLTGAAGVNAALAGYYFADTVTNMAPPPSATDPGGAFIDTLDGRLQHSPTQHGDVMLAVSCVNLGGFPTVQMYEFNAYTAASIDTHYIYGGTSTDDFNPSIAGNDHDSWAVTWDSTGLNRTKTTLQYNLSVAVTSFQPEYAGTNPWAAANTKGKLVKKSTYHDYMGRNGDYSAVQVDPSDSRRFWFSNELVSTDTTFGAGSEWINWIGNLAFLNP